MKRADSVNRAGSLFKNKPAQQNEPAPFQIPLRNSVSISTELTTDCRVGLKMMQNSVLRYKRAISPHVITLEQLNCFFPEIELKIYGIKQALFFSCCTGFKNSIYVFTKYIPTDPGRKLNVYKTFRRRPGHLLNVSCTFNLRPVSTGILRYFKDLSDRRIFCFCKLLSVSNSVLSIVAFTFLNISCRKVL